MTTIIASSAGFRWRTKPPLDARLLRRDIASGLIGRWLFNENSGLLAGDLTGSNASFQPGGGTQANFPSWGSDGVVFDGSHWADSGRNLLGGLAQATIAVTFTTPASFSTSIYVSRFVSSSYTIFGWGYGSTAFPALTISIESGAGNPQIAAGSIPLQPLTTYRGVAVFDGTQATAASRITLYLNGVPNSLAHVESIPAAIYNAATTLGIGRDALHTPSAAYAQAVGTILDLAIWNRPLSAAEVAARFADPWLDVAPPMLRRFVMGTSRPVFTATASGGVVLGGASTPNATFAPSPSGGLVLGGSTAFSATFTAIAAGGIELGGSSAPTTVVFAPTPSGGVELGGSAVPGVTFTPTTRGGLVLGGVATAQAFVPTFRRTPTTYLVGTRGIQE